MTVPAWLWLITAILLAVGIPMIITTDRHTGTHVRPMPLWFDMTGIALVSLAGPMLVYSIIWTLP